MAAGKARLAHAAAGVLPGQDRERDGLRTAISLLLLAVGVAFGGVRLAPLMALKLMGMLVAGSIPFSAMGLALGYFAKPNSAPAVVNLIYLPMSFCSGLWIPIFMLPQGPAERRAGSAALSRRAQLALNAIHMGPYPNPVGGHVEALIGVTLLFLGIAAYGYWRMRERRTGRRRPWPGEACPTSPVDPMAAEAKHAQRARTCLSAEPKRRQVQP